MKTPNTWAAAAVKTLGPALAAKIAKFEGRALIGVKNDEPNPNSSWFVHAYNWIVKRYPKVKQDTKTSENQ